MAALTTTACSTAPQSAYPEDHLTTRNGKELIIRFYAHSSLAICYDAQLVKHVSTTDCRNRRCVGVNVSLRSREQIYGCGVEVIVVIVRNQNVVGFGLRCVVGIRANGVGVDPTTVVADS